MNRYTGIKCPHCQTAFTENDAVVVCPECGAPYHRSCFEEMGGVCQYADRHGDDFSWDDFSEKQRAEEEHRYEDTSVLRCSRCGTSNNPHNIFCDVCGTPLHRPAGNEQEPQNGPYGPGTGGWQGAGWQNPGAGPFRTMGYNPYTTPYGGLGADEEIDGVPVKDLAIFVGESSHYYLPKFKELKTTGHNVINWSAFFLEFLFLIYRKMYLTAAIIFILSNLLSIGLLFLTIGGNPANLNPQTINMVSMVTNGLTIAIRFFIGFSFNRMYMNRCFKKIRELKEKHGDDQSAYYGALTKAGSVSRKAVITVAVIYIVLTMALFYASVLLTPMI